MTERQEQARAELEAKADAISRMKRAERTGADRAVDEWCEPGDCLKADCGMCRWLFESGDPIDDLEAM